tara:strand:+ start:749 stop:1204 length:456 start_codon:yes stop_codon:yes gene_type:complete
MYYIGIDPGINGGCAILDDNNSLIAKKCPPTPQEMANLLFDIHLDDCICLIERVWSMPKQGVVSTFNFGKNFGEWRGILSAFDIPFIEITAQKWMKTYGDLPKIRKDRKHKLKEIAINLYPKNKVTLATSDAILLANLCKETEGQGWETLI